MGIVRSPFFYKIHVSQNIQLWFVRVGTERNGVWPIALREKGIQRPGRAPAIYSTRIGYSYTTHP